MDFLIFALVYPIVWFISRLPMKILYIISDILFFFVYYIFGYRKKVVQNNINTCFPEKSETERKSIVKNFYKHFIDLMIESIKAFTISEKEIKKRYHYKNIELLEELIKKDRSVILTAAHQGNWEWSFYLPSMINIPMYAAYTKLGNKFFDKKVATSRSKFGGRGFKDLNVIKGMYLHQKENIKGLYLLISDQSPQLSKTFYWRDFFNVNVPVHTGAEMLAKKLNHAVVHYTTKRIKRGYFETEFELITENPRDFEDYEITDKYFEIVERKIREQPHCYLWSHKRFKHKNKYEEWQNQQKREAN